MWRNVGVALNRAWRIFGTGLSFAVFGIGGFFLGAVVCIVLRLIIPDPAAYSQAVRRLVSRAFRLFVTFMSLVGVLRWQVEGLQHRQRNRGYLVVANHPTLIDIVFLVGLFEGADCVVKAGVLRNPAWGLLVRAADYVSNEDPAALLEECAWRLAVGRSVVLFPEGTRTVPGQPLAFGHAAGAIAVRAGCECLPVVITCDPPTLYKGLSWHRVPAIRVDFRLRVCPPLRLARSPGGYADQRRATHDFTRNLQEFFTRELAATGPSEPRPGPQPAASPVL